ncbi:MAG TPA: DNA polymerase I [Candidatus Sumerlaeota bacterium]|nr:MAG: DNA polymerase I [candidate division BRC1 bacterium ADurb.Bin183]HOE63300.1 DNA polymerase I [Candidatus Sumerlaeota bacterium]HRR31491.1 DNA polymerase I [Candidatus Sumerlaeia bacterium]HON50745.1 DNA polymerase I [Candidatus Sumerlaeota bacterium]HOR65137.1 DNA polymerase I [Candidatus Sumerlaeota bacterium]
MQRLYIIDGHSILYKAYFAIRGLSTKSGIPTNAVFGFAQMLMRIIRESKSQYLVVAFDSKAPTFRKEMFSDYKANRPIMPDDLQTQLPYVEKMLDALEIKRLAMDGFEADDIIASLAHLAEQKGVETRVVTADKDLFQIVTEKTHILRFNKDNIEEYGPEQVRQKMGVPPERIADLLGLMGDSSDNIPGVAGVGPVTAVKLLNEYKSLENVLEKADNIKNERLKEKIKSGTETALLSRKLAMVKNDVPLESDFDSFRFDLKCTASLIELFQELEFKSLLNALKDAALPQKTSEKAQAEYSIIRNKMDLAEFLQGKQKVKTLSIDTETTSCDSLRCALAGISLSSKPGEAAYIPVGHSLDIAGGEQMSIEDVKEALSSFLQSADIIKCGHNIKFDIQVLSGVGLNFSPNVFDTMIASQLLEPERASHGLKALASEEIGLPMKPISDLIGSGKNMISMAQVPVKAAADYACLDADACLQLMRHFEPQIEENGLANLFYHVEMPLVSALAEMEATGIAIDAAHFENLSVETKAILRRLEGDCFELAGHPFNLNSPKQVAAVLFEELKLPTAKKGKTGYSTDVSVLEEISSKHPMPKKLLEYRGYEKLLTTYIETLPRQVNPKTGRIHTSYIQNGAATGRLSSRDPNLQNIPVRTPEGRAIRAGFIPGEKGWALISADYSQIELRILAHLSGDKALRDGFKKGADIHKLTAAKIFGSPEELITDDMRDMAKVINFGVIYGMTAHGLSIQTKLTRYEAQKFIDDYFNIYRGVKEWIDQTIAEAAQKGYVSTLLGRRRFISDLRSPNKTIRAAAERVAVNAPIQGTSADMIKKAMVAIYNRLKRDNFRARMLMQVHDELVFEAPEDETERLSAMVTEEMEKTLPLDVPVKVGVKTGANWAEC